MNFIDGIFCLILIVGAWLGYRKGLFQELITFSGLLIALVTAFKLLDTGMRALDGWLHIEKVWIPYAAFVGIFVLVFFLIILFGKWVGELVEKTILGSLDKAAGAGLSMIKYAFSVSVLLWLTHVSEIDQSYTALKESLMYPYLLDFAPKSFALISKVIPFQDIFSSISGIIKR